MGERASLALNHPMGPTRLPVFNRGTSQKRMKDREKVREYVFGTLLPTAVAARPGDDASLFDLGLDSLRLMQLLVFVEQSLGVNLPDHEMTPERVESVDAIVEWIGEHR